MAFLKEKNEERKLDVIPSEQLNDFLSEFIITFKRKDRDEFEPSSLRGFLFSFSSQLKVCKYPKNRDNGGPWFWTNSKSFGGSKQTTGKGREGQQAKRSRGFERRGGQHSIHEKPAWNHECWGFIEHAAVYELCSFRVERLRRAPTNDLGRCSTYQEMWTKPNI